MATERRRHVRALRERRGLTQEALAELAGVAPRYLQEVERARTNPSLDMLVALADALDVEPRRLLRFAQLVLRRPGRPKTRR